MKVLRNLTLHEQGPREIEIAAKEGFALSSEPEGVEVAVGRKGLEVAAKRLAAILERVAAERSAALVGGHTGLWVRSLEILAELGTGRPGTGRPELAYFETKRVRDEAGRFVFQPQGLVVIERKETQNNA